MTPRLRLAVRAPSLVWMPRWPASLLTILIWAALAMALGSEEAPPAPAADLILVNGKVVTLDEQGREAQAIAIKGDRIVALGSTEEVRALAGNDTRVVDVGGRLVLPGLVDAHSHVAGVPPDYLDLYGAGSIAEIVAAVGEQAREKGPGEWVVGSGTFMVYSGWDDTRLEEQRWVTRWDLDPVSPDNPVLLIKDGGHAVVLNSYALRLAGISRDTPDPKGILVRDPASREPTGAILKLATEVMSELVPAPGEAERIRAAHNASVQLLEMGTTTVAEAAARPELIRVLESLYRGTEEPLASLVIDPVVPAGEGLEASREFVRAWPVRTGFGDERIRLGALKFFVDGGVTSRTAWFSRPYRGRPDYFGLAELERETLFETVKLADRLGWQLHFHTCGDAAAEIVLQALEAAQRENQSSGRRHLMTHLYVLSRSQMERMRRLGVVAVLQPNFVYALGEHMRAVLSDEQLEHLIPFRSLLEAGVPVALSADGHPQNPFYGLYAAIARRTSTGHVLGAKEAVEVMDALRSYTRTSAYALFEEGRRGSLEPGKLADLIVLDRDILRGSPEEIRDAAVLLTVKGGRIAVNKLE